MAHFFITIVHREDKHLTETPDAVQRPSPRMFGPFPLSGHDENDVRQRAERLYPDHEICRVQLFR
jgi:hypothetical protein